MVRVPVTRLPQLAGPSLVLRVIALAAFITGGSFGDCVDGDEPRPDVYHHPNGDPLAGGRGSPRVQWKRNNLLLLDQTEVDLCI